MGVVFLADHTALSRRVAIKILHPHLAAHAMFTRRFRDEAQAASRVRHHGSIEVIDYDVATDGTEFMVMELARGRSLGEILDEQEIPLQRALGILDQILEALDAAHACSVIHADIKSDNFMVDLQPDGDVVTMVDFGLAQLDGAAANRGLVAGTPEYLAPELVRGEPPTCASDVYGVGVILYELLTGATPFASGPTSEILRCQLEEAVVPPSSRRPDRRIPCTIDRIVLRALAKDPGARFASARDFRTALASVSLERETSILLRPRPEATEPPPWGARRFARGSDARGAGHDELRSALAGALASGDIPGIAGAYMALANALAGELMLGAAICELEEGLDVLTGAREPTGAAFLEPVGQLVVALEAMYELGGESRRARSAVASADDRATLITHPGQRGCSA
jgi:serine/threonine protein kinase